MATVVIAGVSGCIGSWVAHRLVKDGHRVVGADISDAAPVLDLLGSTGQVERVRLDVSDQAAYLDLLASIKPDGVVHLASLLMPSCRQNPGLCVDVNVKSFQTALEGARLHGYNLAYASSAWVLDSAIRDRPVTEDDAPAPQSLYGVYKLTNEWMARTYASDFGVVCNGLRPYIVYGPGRQTGLTADLNLALMAAAEGRAFTVGFGGEVALQHASDIADLFIKLALNPVATGRAYNVRGTVTSVKEAIGVIERVTGTTGLIDYAGDELPIAANVSDDLLQRDYGPFMYLGLQEGLQATLDAYAVGG